MLASHKCPAPCGPPPGPQLTGQALGLARWGLRRDEAASLAEAATFAYYCGELTGPEKSAGSKEQEAGKEGALKGLENSCRRHKRVQRKERKRNVYFCALGEREPRKNLERTFPE